MSNMMPGVESTQKLTDLADKLAHSEAAVSELQGKLSNQHSKNIEEREATLAIREARADEVCG